jgi:ribosomal protein L33
MKQVVDAEKQVVDTDIAHTPAGDGCGVVFADSVSLQRPVFSRYCPDCRRKPGGRFRYEILMRCVAACSGRIAVSGGWRLTCSGCGERFFATTPQRRRCDQCRH